MSQHLTISIRITIVLLVITCGLYPALVWGIGQVAFRDQANGSLLVHSGKVVGSELIGQNFAGERYFHPRPSASGSDGYDGTASGGTNLGPTSKKLRDAVAEEVKSFDTQANVPADAVTSSASGLDPHISPANAYAQAWRVARVNGLTIAQVRALITRNTEERFLGVFGEQRLNVLRLNLSVREVAHR